MIKLFDEIKRSGSVRIIGTNYHIITDRDLKRLRDRDIELGRLRRKLSDRQIEGILDGRSHVARNPIRRKAA